MPSPLVNTPQRHCSIHTIDTQPDQIITVWRECGKFSTIFAHGRDNADLIQLFNLGYERGAAIVRLKRFGDGAVKTPAYCPKTFAGLKIARIPGPTKTRTIIINMRPKSDAEAVERHIDKVSIGGSQA